jgi:glucokinase
MAILGAGTGLGEAILLRGGHSTEGEHQDFAPQAEGRRSSSSSCIDATDT